MKIDLHKVQDYVEVICSSNAVEIPKPCDNSAIDAFHFARVPRYHALYYAIECVPKIKSIRSVISYVFNISGCVSSVYPILIWWLWECVLYLFIIIKSDVWIINHRWELGQETMVRAVYLHMFLYHFIYISYHGVSESLHYTTLTRSPMGDLNEISDK